MMLARILLLLLTSNVIILAVNILRANFVDTVGFSLARTAYRGSHSHRLALHPWRTLKESQKEWKLEETLF